MDRRTFRRSSLSIVSIMAALIAAIGLGGYAAQPVRAVTIECPAAASQAAGGAPLTASPVSSTALAAFPEGGGDLTVFAAASLTESFGEIKTTLEAANPGLSITYNFAGSPALVTQLTEGAEAEVVALASTRQMTAAVEAGVVEGSPQTFTQNRLAVVVPTDNPAGVQSMADLGNEGLKLVLAAAEVPVGQYARESVCKAGAETATYGDGFVDRVGANVVSEEDNVKAVLAKVQLGEADAGIVYTTDVTAEVAGDVQVIEIPEAINVVARYPIAAVAGGDSALAQPFIAYVLGPDGQAILQEYGFEPKP